MPRLRIPPKLDRDERGRFLPASPFGRWFRLQFRGSATQSERTAALYGWNAGRKYEHDTLLMAAAWKEEKGK